MNNKCLDIISPIDNAIVASRELCCEQHINDTIATAKSSQVAWRNMPLEQRSLLLTNAVDYLLENKATLAQELSLQMGRPIRYAQGEIDGLAQRARHMINIAPNQLADQKIKSNIGNSRFIRREPLGVVFTIAPWNYPYLTAVNSIIPALMAGNSVILKHSAQTLLCAERFFEALQAVGLPQGVFQYLHLNHAQTAQVIQNPAVDFISFTGSVAGGKAVEQAAAGQFKGVALELGGKDPAYVREDADLVHAIEQITDGAFFNSGQSCCGIERVYVHQTLFDDVVAGIVATVNNYQLGDPMDQQTTLGPLVSTKAAQYVRQQINEAIEQGATAHIDSINFPADTINSPYLAPQVLTNVNHSMSVMKDESFGPVVALMAVSGDDEAIALMNDSEFGLTASIWTQDEMAAIDIGARLNTGTVFMNRCDYLDPALPWVGVKNSGRGCALSTLGYDQLTRPKSFNFNLRK
jgi:acyl-CoA reductase-like NAD-dependent aldehyde dehydrogenase